MHTSVKLLVHSLEQLTYEGLTPGVPHCSLVRLVNNVFIDLRFIKSTSVFPDYVMSFLILLKFHMFCNVRVP